MPGGMPPDTTVQVSVLPPLFIKDSSAFCPALRAGRTHTPLTMVPPLVLGEHSWVSPCTASARPAAARPASNVPATTTAAIPLFIAPPSAPAVPHLLGRRSVSGDCGPRSTFPRAGPPPRPACGGGLPCPPFPHPSPQPATPMCHVHSPRPAPL